MAIINPSLPEKDQPRGTEELDLLSALTALLAEFNGNIDNANVDAAAGIALSKINGGITFVGSTVIDGSEARTNTAYGLLATPDRVQNVPIASGSLLWIGYMAIFKNSVKSAGRAAIFLGSNQLKKRDTTAPAGDEAFGVNDTNETLCYTSPFGLQAESPGSGGTVAADATTGMVLGKGVIPVAGIPSGTIDVSVQVKASSGSITLRQRKLYVVVFSPPT